MISKKKLTSYGKRYGIKLPVICFWLLLWELASRLIDQDIFLVSPVKVIVTLIELGANADFWQTILFSSLGIIGGFVLALLSGTILAIVSYKLNFIKELLAPLMKLIQATPVASFIILALIWINKRNLSVLTSFLMVLPLIYSNVYQGLMTTDVKLLQMAKVFRLGAVRKINAIYIPTVMPYMISAVSVGLGLCWKAGIAAEVIGIPSGSIGEKLYSAKLYLMTNELLAWTIVIIIFSVLFEKLVVLLLNRLQAYLNGERRSTWTSN